MLSLGSAAGAPRRLLDASGAGRFLLSEPTARLYTPRPGPLSEPKATLGSDNGYCQNQDPELDTPTAATPHASKSLAAPVADDRISSHA